MKISCLGLFVFGMFCVFVGAGSAALPSYRYGLEHQELLGYRKDYAVDDKAKSMNWDTSSRRLGPIVDKLKSGK